MTTILSEGVIVPDVGDVNWAGKLEVNWNLLNGALANLSGNVKLDRDNTWTGEQSFTLPIVGSLTGTASKAIADEDGTSIKTGYVNVAGNQTISGDKSFTGSNTFNNILPNATNTYALGSSSYQWSSVYAQKYYYNGTAWGLDQNNRWSAAQFYSQNSIHVRNVEPGVAPSSDVSAGIRFENANASYVFADIVGRVFTSGTTFVNLIASNKFTNGALDPNGTTISRGFQIGLRADGSGFIYTDCGWRNNLIPHSANTGLNLGTSTNKWKTLNGINPGALSLPDSANAVNIDITNWNKRATNNAIGSITASMDGWINVQIQRDVDFAVWVIGTYRQLFRAGIQSNGKYLVMLMLPVTKNATVTLYTLPLDALESDLVFGVYRFYPCLGNV